MPEPKIQKITFQLQEKATGKILTDQEALGSFLTSDGKLVSTRLSIQFASAGVVPACDIIDISHLYNIIFTLEK